MSETRDTDEHIVDIDNNNNHHHGSPCGSNTQGSPNPTFWEPDPMESDGSSGHGGFNQNNSNAEAPEKELTLFAVRLAIMEQLASWIGILACTWASVILLGGFAIVMSQIDFWFVTIMLGIESARIYSRSGEIEWQHQSTWTFTNGPRGNFRPLVHIINAFIDPTSATQADLRVEGRGQMHALGQVGSRSRTWNIREVPLISFWGLEFLLKNIGKVLIWLQVSFALVSMSLSLHRLALQDFGEVLIDNYQVKTRNIALNLFYSLALANDLLFLMEKIYWYSKINQAKLLECVGKKCRFESSKATTDLMKRFFYDVYAECINNSIFSGLNKDLVTYAEKLLGSEVPEKNLMGAEILWHFVNHDQFAFDTIHKVGTSGKTMERLVEMLGWKADKEIRMLGAQLVSKISGKRKGSIGIAKIPGSLEAIASLLNTGNHDNESGHLFNLLGILILRNVSSEHQNCEKIIKSPGLISKIIEFTDTTLNPPIIDPTGTSLPNFLLDGQPIDSPIRLVRLALQVVLSLASSKGDTGNALRQQISRNVFIVGYIRKILKHGTTHKILQKVSIQILTFLAMDEEATERIASTGGVINLLFKIFFEPWVSEETSVSVEAGEALSMLTIKSEKSCNMILQEYNVLVQLTEMVKEKLQGPYASRILHNVCVYAISRNDGRLDATIQKIFPTVLERTISEKGKLLEVSVGLLVALCKLMGPTSFHEELAKAEIDLTRIAQRLIDILERYKYPDIKVPRLRRFVIELMIWMKNNSDSHLELFKNSEMKQLLESVAETTTELENFHLFSGSVGLRQHSVTVADLLGEASVLFLPGSSTSLQDNN